MCGGEWRWRPEVSDTVPLGFETGSLACTCGSPRSLWAWPGICLSLPRWTRISSMHHHVYLVTLKLKTEFRAPCLYGKYFTPKLDPQSKSWVLKAGFRSLANTGAKGQSFVPQLRRFSVSSVGGKVNKDFARGWEHPQMRDNEAMDESAFNERQWSRLFKWKCLLSSWDLTQPKTLWRDQRLFAAHTNTWIF